MAVTKAVIAAAGYGTRFLPATKNVPKELLTLLDKPVLEYITEECVEAGITDIVIVTRHGSGAIEDYLDSEKSLENLLESKGKTEYLEKVRHVYEKANFIFVRQSSNLPYGTASTLWAAKSVIGKQESFAFLYGDDVFAGERSAIGELIESYEAHRKEGIYGVLGAYQVPSEEIGKYGALEYDESNGYKLFKRSVEKPKPEDTDSNLARVGRFVYHASIFDFFDFDMVKTNPRGEFELTDVENAFKEQFNLIVQDVSATWYPAGEPKTYIRSTLQLAAEHPEYRAVVEEFVKEFRG